MLTGEEHSVRYRTFRLPLLLPDGHSCLVVLLLLLLGYVEVYGVLHRPLGWDCGESVAKITQLHYIAYWRCLECWWS